MTILDEKEKIKKLIESSEHIYIMAHKYLDLDAIGSAIGMYEFIKEYDKKTTIIIDDRSKEAGVKKIIDKMGDLYRIRRASKIKSKITDNDLLIVVDTNKDTLLQNESILPMFKNVMVIDHHDLTEKSINKGLVIIDEDSSSTCEMVADLLDAEKISFDEDVATILLAGIVLDTNNYVLKTTANTYRISYILATKGADPTYVQYLLKQDMKSYIARQKVITNVKIVKNIAITAAKSNVKYKREELAKIADTLLQFHNIEASFVIGKLDDNTVGISARSQGKINVGKILENFNGGGDNHEAGARFEAKRLKDVEDKLKNILKNI